MYFEKAEVKEYTRDKNKPTEKKFKQIYLGDSKFKKDSNVVILSVKDFDEIKKNSNPEKISNLEDIIEDLKGENHKLHQDLKVAENNNDELNAKINDIIEESKEIVSESEAKVESIKVYYKEKLEEKDFKIDNLHSKFENEKDISKTLLLALYSYAEQGTLNRILNRTPKLAKQILKDNTKPIESNISKND